MGRLRLRLKKSSAFLPSTLYGVGDVGYVFDTTDLTKMWQSNTGVTTAAFASVVGELIDISGKSNNFLSAADDTSRPTLQNVNNGLIQYDGVSSRLVLGAAQLVGAGSATLMFAIRGAASASGTFIWSEQNSLGGAMIYAPGTAHVNADAYAQIINAASTSLANAGIVTGQFDDTLKIVTFIDSGSLISVYVNGVFQNSLAYTRSGTLTADQTNIGAKNVGGLSSFFAGYVGCGGAIGRVLGGTHTTAGSELNKLYNWIAGKHGLATL